MNPTPLVSVVIPLYNKEQWIKRALQSVITQSYTHLQILVVNDGSTDNSAKIVKTIEDRRIQLIEQPNGGVSSARNRGIKEATGEYLTFLDADDMWLPNHIEYLLEGFKHYPDASMIANRLTDTQAKPPVKNTLDTHNTLHFTPETYLLSLSRNRFPLHIGSTMYRLSMVQKHHIQFDEAMRLGEDINFMLRVNVLGTCLLSNYTGLIYYHEDTESAMHQTNSHPELLPHYFSGLEHHHWSPSEQQQIKTFLSKEYLKKAYQNRGKPFNREELHLSLQGSVIFRKFLALVYLTVRFLPSLVLRILQWIRSRRT